MDLSLDRILSDDDNTTGRYYGPGVDLPSNRNEYQVYFLEVKAAGAKG